MNGEEGVGVLGFGGDVHTWTANHLDGDPSMLMDQEGQKARAWEEGVHLVGYPGQLAWGTEEYSQGQVRG